MTRRVYRQQHQVLILNGMAMVDIPIPRDARVISGIHGVCASSRWAFLRAFLSRDYAHRGIVYYIGISLECEGEEE